MRKQLLVLLVTLTSAIGFAQKGTITGTLSDKDLNNEPLPFANVVIKGTTNGVTTDDNGTFSISIEPGTYVVEFSFLGYETQTETVVVKANETVTVNKSLGSGAYTLQDVQVQAQLNREKESALLIDQKNAVEIKQNIGAQELSRKGVTDVANAVAKTTGVTKQGSSGTIFVRGLGDRYNTTTMNGLPMPSNNADRKNINLEIFNTDIVEYISIDKVYMSRLYGDFGGGNVDIVSKTHSGAPYLRLEIGSNVNTNAINEDSFLLHSVPNAFGFATTDMPQDLNAYDFRSWGMDEKAPYAGALQLSGGHSWNVGEEGKLSLFATASMANKYESVTDGKANSGISGTGVINRRFDSFDERSYSTNATAMANVGYKINSKNKINFNSLFINTSEQQTEEYRGLITDVSANSFTRINTFTKTALFVNQLLGEHKFGERLKFNWAGGFNNVKDEQPDRTWNILNDNGGVYTVNSVSAPNNNRYFQELTEEEINALATAEYKIGKDQDGLFKGKLTVGYNGRFKTRDFEATQYNFKVTNAHLGDAVNPDRLDEFFNQANYSANFFTITTFRGGTNTEPQTYNGDLMIHAGFASVDYQLTPKLFAIVGLRAEQITQDVDFNTVLGGIGTSSLDKTAFLPNLIMKYELNEKQNLRFAFSKTYTLPQFKENAPFTYERLTQVYFGNRDLYESDNYNVDLKWELFPNSDEVYSLTAFGKYIQNPINEVVINSSTNDISWVNSGDQGYAYGIEAEVRKNIWSVDETNSKKLSAGLNVSYLKTDQELSDEKVNSENSVVQVNFTNKKDAFSGASDLLMNADLSYFTEWNNKNSNLNATLAYNLFSDRIFAIGTQQKGNIVEKSVGTLDFIVKSKLTESFGIGLTARNLTNPTIKYVQENNNGDVLVETHKKGLGIGLSVNYQF